jgi:hypothetical protein
VTDFPDKVALGKKEYKYDPRTIVLGAHIQPDAVPPEEFDYDHGKKAFPLDVWGNDENGDCVFVSEANGLVRLERAESRRTIAINTDVVLGKYRTLTGSQSPGDAKDEGYVILDALSDWRHAGWNVGKHDHKIEAYGELDKNNPVELRRAIWLLGGIYTGFGLPAYLGGLVSRGEKVWDVAGDGPETEPYSWGGHAMFCKRYDHDGIYALTWGEEVYLTNAFVRRYMDEAWAVVDALDAHSRYLDVDALTKILRGMASNVEG